MNEDFLERLINAACTAVGIALCSTLNVYLIAAGVFMVVMSFPDCLGYFSEGYAVDEIDYDFEFEDDDTVVIDLDA